MIPQLSNSELSQRLQSALSGKCKALSTAYGEVTLEVDVTDLPAVAVTLRDDPQLSFKQLVDLCGVDYLTYGRADWETSNMTTSSGFSRGVEKDIFAELNDADEASEISQAQGDQRFAVVYHFLSHAHNSRLRLRVFVPGTPPILPSVYPIWPAANWFEREAFDLFGILFEGHPDLRRILTDYGFVGNPFRKDFPLIGEVELRYDPAKARVVYEPVSIEPRTLVPRVIRHDERYNNADESA